MREREFQPLNELGELPRPNILVILGDDMGWGDLSCYGAPTIRTPNLDGIAASGVRFTQAYSQSPVCSPTRIGLYTGRYPGRLAGGLPEPIQGPSPENGIPPGHPTLASLLKGVGYHTAMIGKWHCGFLPWFSPTRLGWDEFFGNFSGGVDYFSKLAVGSNIYDLYENEVEYQDLRYYTEILGERAAMFLRREHRRPWLLNLNFTAAHWPWEGPADQAVSDELTARARAGDRLAGLHLDGGSLNTYRGMVEAMDKAVGIAMSALHDSGQLANTLVFFASDNGGGTFSYTWPLRHDPPSGPITSRQPNLLEGSIRVPTILCWPGKLRPHQVSHELVITADWTATFLEIASATAHPDYPPDGISLASYLLRGNQLPGRDLFWRVNGERALRRGDLKYLRRRDGIDHLYDLGADVREQAELAAKRPDDLAALRSAWEAVNATLLPYPG